MDGDLQLRGAKLGRGAVFPAGAPRLGVGWGGREWAWTLSMGTGNFLCDPKGCSPPGSSVHGIFQARILEQVVISYSRGSSQSRIKPTYLVSPALAGKILYHCTTWKVQKEF